MFLSIIYGLVKSSPDLITRHSTLFPIIADSGANFHMFRDREFFTSLTPATGKVILGDGTTTLPIQGIGTIQMKIGDHILKVDDVRYVPGLSESIYSLFLHVRTPHHGLQSSFENGLHIIFPTFQTKAILGSDDIYLDAIPTTLILLTLYLYQSYLHVNISLNFHLQLRLNLRKRIIYFELYVSIIMRSRLNVS